MHPGQGPGLSLHDLGETGGSDTVSLLESEIPYHTHQISAADMVADVPSPARMMFASPPSGNNYAGLSNTVQMSESMLAPAGGDQPHNNMQPYLTFYFCIALQGVFPPRT